VNTMTHDEAVRVLTEVPELLVLASSDPTNARLRGASVRIRDAIAALTSPPAGEVEKGREISALHAGVLLALGTILELPEGVPLKDATYVDAVISLRHRAERAESERDALREALEGIVGDPDDPNIGWLGSNASARHLYKCEHCRVEHDDCGQMPHTEQCPVPAAIRALTEG
jgi:hypothetical protein